MQQHLVQDGLITAALWKDIENLHDEKTESPARSAMPLFGIARGRA